MERLNGRIALPKWRSVFWIVLFLVLCIFLQKFKFHFLYVEQNQLFLFDKYYLYSALEKPSGLSRIISDFCMQFFLIPYAGAVVVGFLLTVAGFLTHRIFHAMLHSDAFMIQSALPVALFLLLVPNPNYQYAGIVAYNLMLLAVWFSVKIPKEWRRFMFVNLMSLILFWFAGAVSVLLVICIFVWKIMVNPIGAFKYLIPFVLLVSMVYVCEMYAIIPDFLQALMPDSYYAYRSGPSFFDYVLWGCTPLLIIFAHIFRKRDVLLRGSEYAVMGVAFFIVLSCTVMSGRLGRFDHFYEELDCHVRMKQWDRVIEKYGNHVGSYSDLYDCCLNLALAEKGVLADKMFSYDQQGVPGLYLTWNRTPVSASLLSELYYSMGHISSAQRMAFESNVNAVGECNPRMMQRLVETNLIGGAYGVAEKYVSVLEKSLFYRRWAREHWRFLWNDKAVEVDSVLGSKRKCVAAANFLCELDGLDKDLQTIVDSNPGHRQTIQYMGALYLLARDMDSFEQMLDKYAGTEVLAQLPKSFQEAIVILSEVKEGDFLGRFQVDDRIVARYKSLREASDNWSGTLESLGDKLKNDFSDTFWYYAIFKNN